MRFPKLFQKKSQGSTAAGGSTSLGSRSAAGGIPSPKAPSDSSSKGARASDGSLSQATYPNQQALNYVDENVEARTNRAYAAHSPEDLPAWYTSPKPPRWFHRALVVSVLTVFVAVFIWRAMGNVTGLFINLVIAFFLALVMEPMILWLVKRGWKRGMATITVLFTMIVLVIVLIAVFGQMFYQQTAQLLASIPAAYESAALWIEGKLEVEIPAMSELQSQLLDAFGQDAAGQVLAIGAGVASTLFNASVVLLVAFYMAAAGPKFRASVCAWVTPNRQEEFLRLWEITQRKVSDYINSRLVLATVCVIFTYIFFLIIKLPYALPLAIFVGVVSQFVPTIGTYIGGALPIVFALTSGNVTGAVLILVFIVLYQQVENMWFSPLISSMALELNPAIAFVVVLAFGAIFGALGAFLALPVAATIQAIGSTYLQRHELVDSALLRDPGSNISGAGSGSDPDFHRQIDQARQRDAKRQARRTARDKG